MPAHVRRIGLFGGTFNPIHVGHLRSAEEVREAQELDVILFVPSGSPPHKAQREVASAAHRVAMVKLAIARHPQFRMSTIEVDRRGHSYSVDTLRALGVRYPHAAFTFILGLDAFREIGTWKDYRELFELCDFVVTSRPSADAKFPSLARLLPVAARKDFWYQPGSTNLKHRSGHQVTFQSLTNLEIAASSLRERIAGGRSIRYLVPSSVELYLHTHHLYEGKARPR